jgi:predicted nucleic acid-binding protein
MKTYLLDASAAVEIYLNPYRRPSKIDDILEEKDKAAANIFIPNICVAEAFNTFARKHFAPKKDDNPLSSHDYQRCLEQFREDIHWGKKIYPYDLNRYHIIATDKIVLAEHLHLPKADEKDHLNTFDILVIAMACELAYLGERENTFLVTGDARMHRVCETLRKKQIDILNEGPLGKLDQKRWRPPYCTLIKPRSR